MYRNGGMYDDDQVIEVDRHSRSQPVADSSADVSLVRGELRSRRFLRREPGVGVDDHWVVVGLW
jgi:hypothetical protein